MQSNPAFYIGAVPIESPLLLAPMEDVSHLPMRLICKRIAKPGLMFTEFVSAMAIHYGAHKTIHKMKIDPGERPLAIQIFGSEPAIMAETARIAESMGADILDINMGCWVPKVCKTGSGAALLKDPDHAEQIVRSVVNAVKIPVTVKVRAGWDYSSFAAPELAKRFEGAGIKMLTLHARFAKQGFDGEADWNLIRQLRDSVSIPLIGNGDVKTPELAQKMMRETGCNGVMVGRAAISNPWLLRDIGFGLSGQPPGPSPTLSERVFVAIEHVEGMVAFEEAAEREFGTKPGAPAAEVRACRAIRGLIPLYIKGTPGAAVIRERLTQCSSTAEYEAVLSEFLERSLCSA